MVATLETADGVVDKSLNRETKEANEVDVERCETQASDDVKMEWNHPRRNMLRLAACFYGFIVQGMNDSSIGVLIPYLEVYYKTNYTVISISFLAPFFGYLVSSLLNDYFHRRIGRWGISVIGTCSQMACYIINACHPPLPLFIIAYAIAGFGNGFVDGGWNIFVGNFKSSNELMGMLHAFYGLGGILCPTIFTAMTGSGRQWHECYYVMIGMSAVSITCSTLFFKGDGGPQFLEEIKAHPENNKYQTKDVLRLVFSRIVLGTALVLALYVGCEVGIGGWISTFMINVRGGAKSEMGYVTTGFWTGLTLGRVVLGFVSGYIRHEEVLACVYMGFCVLFLLLAWLVKHLITTAVCIALYGFFMGPLFPTVMVVALKKLPRKHHVTGIGAAAAISGVGGCVLPMVTGVIANDYGSEYILPFTFASLGSMAVAWLVFLSFKPVSA